MNVLWEIWGHAPTGWVLETLARNKQICSLKPQIFTNVQVAVIFMIQSMGT